MAAFFRHCNATIMLDNLHLLKSYIVIWRTWLEYLSHCNAHACWEVRQHICTCYRNFYFIFVVPYYRVRHGVPISGHGRRRMRARTSSPRSTHSKIQCGNCASLAWREVHLQSWWMTSFVTDTSPITDTRLPIECIMYIQMYKCTDMISKYLRLNLYSSTNLNASNFPLACRAMITMGAFASKAKTKEASYGTPALWPSICNAMQSELVEVHADALLTFSMKVRYVQCTVC